MSTMVPTTAAEAVANGAQLLDDTHPGWWRLIDLSTLRLSECESCVCGQLAVSYGIGRYPIERYEGMLATLDLRWLDTDRLYGFNLVDENIEGHDNEEAAWRELEQEWHKVIVARLHADALVPEKEEVLV